MSTFRTRPPLAVRETTAYRAANTALACTTAELLTAVIGGKQGGEIASKLLAAFGGIKELYNASERDFKRCGVGNQTTARIKAALVLGVRLNAEKAERQTIASPADAAGLVQDMQLLEKEQLRVILLNTRNQVLDIETVYTGSVNQAQVRIGEVFRSAVIKLAAGIIVVHNHPSGDPTPSPDDVALTRVMKDAGRMLDIALLDHLVLGGDKWVSLKERGLLS